MKRYTPVECRRIEREGGTAEYQPRSIASGHSYRSGNYVWSLVIVDYLTERILTVKDFAGTVIGQRDPFAAGIPVSKVARTKAVADCVKSIIRDHEAIKWPATAKRGDS